VTEFLFLGLEIFLGMLVGLHFARHALHNLDAGAFQRLNLVGVIRE